MHPIQTLLGQIAAIVAVFPMVPYIWSILKGRTRPQRTSYAIWSAIEAIQLVSYFAAGATTTKWALLVININSFVILGLSFKYGMGGRGKFDILCLLLASVAIMLWLVTNSAALAVYLTTLAGAIGYLPTIQKSYRWPKTENTLSWLTYVVATTLNLCALTSAKMVIVLPPLAGFTSAVIVSGLLVFPRWKIKNISRQYHRPRPQEL